MKITIKIFIVFSFGFLFGCSQKQKAESKPEKIKEEVTSTFPIIIKSNKIKRFTFDDDNTTWLTTAFYEFNYIGKIKDTIVLENRIKFLRYENPNKKSSSEHLKYCVDLNYPPRFGCWDNAKIEIQINDKLVSNSIPVLIRNNNKDTIAIGYGTQIPIIMEALNENYQWKPIQKKFVYMCGVGLGSIILPPGEIAITLAPIFTGFTKTRLRLVLGNNISKPFWGFINKRQFESKFENGEFKAEYIKENSQNNDS